MRFNSKTDSTSLQMLARCIQEIENRTLAEPVLVLRRSSGLYRDVDYLTGAGLALLVLGVALYSAWELDPLAVPLPMIAAFATGARLSHVAGRYGPRRWLTTATRRKTQASHGASGYFHEHGVDQTRSRAGILLYYSALEQQAVLLADERARVALGERLEGFRRELQEICDSEATVTGSVDRLAEFLRTLGVYLGKVLPCAPGTHHSQLSSRPDIGGEQ